MGGEQGQGPALGELHSRALDTTLRPELALSALTGVRVGRTSMKLILRTNAENCSLPCESEFVLAEPYQWTGNSGRRQILVGTHWNVLGRGRQATRNYGFYRIKKGLETWQSADMAEKGQIYSEQLRKEAEELRVLAAKLLKEAADLGSRTLDLETAIALMSETRKRTQ